MNLDEVSVIQELTEIANWSRVALRITAWRYCECLISHLMSFAAESPHPHLVIGRMIDTIRIRSQTPEFAAACAYKPNGG